MINGEEGASRTDYSPSEDDNVIVQGVSGDEGALGYFGFSYYEENQDTLKALEVDGGDGCVAPSVEAAQDDTYTPLSRPLFMYVKQSAFDDNEERPGLRQVHAREQRSRSPTSREFVPLSQEQIDEQLRSSRKPRRSASSGRRRRAAGDRSRCRGRRSGGASSSSI